MQQNDPKEKLRRSKFVCCGDLQSQKGELKLKKLLIWEFWGVSLDPQIAIKLTDWEHIKERSQSFGWDQLSSDPRWQSDPETWDRRFPVWSFLLLYKDRTPSTKVSQVQRLQAPREI